MKRLLAGLVAVCAALAGCAELKHVGGGLELQPAEKAAPKAFSLDLTAMSITCLAKEMILTTVVVDGAAVIGALCEGLPEPKPGRPI